MIDEGGGGLVYKGFPLLDTPSKVGLTVRMFFAERFDLIAFDNAVMEEEFKNAGFDHTEVSKRYPCLKLLLIWR